MLARWVLSARGQFAVRAGRPITSEKQILESLMIALQFSRHSGKRQPSKLHRVHAITYVQYLPDLLFDDEDRYADVVPDLAYLPEDLIHKTRLKTK